MTAVPVPPAGTHAMKSSSARFYTRSTTDTSHCARVAPAMNAAAFAMNGLSILSVQRCLARPMRVAHDPAKIQPIVVRNFAPAFPGLMHCYDVVEALAGFISQHVCSLQFAVAESGRSSLGLQRIDGNAGFLGNSRQHSSARNSDSEHQEECRYDQA